MAIGGGFGAGLLLGSAYFFGGALGLVGAAVALPVLAFGIMTFISIPSGPAVLAQRILDNSENITIAPDSTGDCLDTGGNRIGPQTTLKQAAHDQPLTICSAGCKGKLVCTANPAITLNPNLLNATKDMAAGGSSFRIESLVTGSHKANSWHYTGDAEDLIPPDHSPASFEKLRNFFADPANAKHSNVDRASCETQTGRFVGCLDKLKSGERITHVHVQFKRGAQAPQ